MRAYHHVSPDQLQQFLSLNFNEIWEALIPTCMQEINKGMNTGAAQIEYPGVLGDDAAAQIYQSSGWLTWTTGNDVIAIRQESNDPD